MAAAPGLLFLLLVFGPPWRGSGQPDPSTDRRFSEHKLCADEECSMLMYRGEALDDFTGPDCRFVNFKKGDPVYVYYKLAGGSPEVWAGSVGRIFGYFPKDLIKVVHEYTEKELQIPADETDFVCFDGGQDDFDNYNIEELLGFLDLYDSATGDSEQSGKHMSPSGEKVPTVSKESGLEPEPVEANAETNESMSSENTKDLEASFVAQKNPVPSNSEAHATQEDLSPFEPFEEILQDPLKGPESENNKTSNGSQASSGQEKMDAYKLLKKEMSLDLKTKFGSTADALVSDDETTRLVTSLEDGFDEELDAEYYTIEKEEEDDSEDLDTLPLLTFTSGEDDSTPAMPGVEKHSTEKEQPASTEHEVELTLPPDFRNDDTDILTDWGDTLFSIVTGGKERPGLRDLEGSNSEEERKEDDDMLGPESKQEKPPPPTDPVALDVVGDSPLSAQVPNSSPGKDSENDPDLHLEGIGKQVQESQKALEQEMADSENKEQDGLAVYRPAQVSEPSSLPDPEKGKDTLKSTSEDKEDGLNEAAVHISKDTPHEVRPVKEILTGGADNESAHGAQGGQRSEEMSKEESLVVAPLLGDAQHSVSVGDPEEGEASMNPPEPHSLSVEHPQAEFKDPDAKIQDQAKSSSSPGGVPFPEKWGEEVPVLGTNVSWQQDGNGAAAVIMQEKGKMKLAGDEGQEDATHTELPHHKTVWGTQEVGKTDPAAGAQVPGFQMEKAGAEEDDHLFEELLEDENALSARQAKEEGLAPQDRRFDVSLPVPEVVVLGTAKPDPQAQANKQETQMIPEAESKSEPAAEGVGGLGEEPSRMGLAKEERPQVAEKAQSSSEVNDLPDHQTQPPESGQVFQQKDAAFLKQDHPQEQPKSTELSQKLGRETGSEEDAEDGEKSADEENQGSASEALEDDLLPGSPQMPAEPGLGPGGRTEDLPIISSFFKDEQSLQRFQKYFDVRELEVMLHEMALKLKSVQQESLPYNVEKVLDKVFRVSESHILSEAEKMLDARVAKNRDLGVKENNIFEEAAVLDDIQDLIYFVRYKHSAVEESAPLITAPPPEETWGGPTEEIQPPPEADFPQESVGDLTVQLPEEPSGLDQPVPGDTSISEKPELEEALSPEEDSGPVLGLIATEGTPVNAVDVQKQPETKGEESASATPLENAVLLTYSFLLYVSNTLVATLPDGVQPGPDFHGLPWKPVLLTAFLGIASFAVFFWRTILVVKNKVYQVTEQQISEKVKNIMKENAELVQKLSDYEKKIKESKKHVQETKKQNIILSDEAVKFKDKIKRLEESNQILDDTAKNLRVMLESEREQNAMNQNLILENKKSIETLKNVISMNASEFSEVQIALNEAKLSEEKVKSECHRVQEENARLKKKKEQLQQEIEDWSKSHAELSEQIKSFEKSKIDTEVALTDKDGDVSALTNCITQLNLLECESASDGPSRGGNESDELAKGELGGNQSEKMKNQIKQMMDVSRTQTAISVVEEDLKLLQSKLRASMSTKCSLEDQIKKLQDDHSSLQSTKAELEDECKTLKQKVEILSELYQQKEMALQKKLSQEEYEREDREQRLSTADEKAVLASEEVKTYKRRIEEMEEELQKTERSFKNQIATHEKKAHENWLKARAAERAIAEEKKEAANLRHKLLEMSQKMAMLKEEPVIVKPMPGRPHPQSLPRRGPLSQNGSFGTSPVSGGEYSPPLLAEPPARPLSATLGRRDVPRSEFGSMDGPFPRPRWPPEVPGKPPASDPGSGSTPMLKSSSRGSSPTKGMDEGKVNMVTKGPPSFPGVPFIGPLPPPIRYGPPPQLGRPFVPRPPPPPFVPAMRPPLGLREYAPGIPPGKPDLLFDPREFVPGHPPFRPSGPPGPREYLIPATRLPPPPQDYAPSAAARDLLPSGSRAEPQPASQSSSQDCSQALKQSP
ncbi:transport and Golgi organization protein 1 homolog isoform X1 [Ochotona princeps]|uniref:transport and Golgi organization protein 1 homolog isoform X1 n=1 Tax=Ochotona princeps TaxID=9978 RepID=UPI0027146BFB|nr:transport and Golgi organization protein 1 homolog isoform X1 [Ochotona princeps]